MENPSHENNYEGAKQKAKEFYGKIGRIRCPVINDYIVFNSIGFRHLTQKRGIFRTKKEQRKRFALLWLVRKILKDTGANVKYEQRRIGGSHIDYWIFTAKRGGKVIRLVARRFGSGKIHFLTVYEKSPK